MLLDRLVATAVVITMMGSPLCGPPSSVLVAGFSCAWPCESPVSCFSPSPRAYSVTLEGGGRRERRAAR